MPSPRFHVVSAPTAMGRFQLVASGLGLRAVSWPGEEKKGGSRQAEGGKKKAKATGLPQSGDKSRIESGMTSVEPQASSLPASDGLAEKQAGSDNVRPVVQATPEIKRLLKTTAKQLADYFDGRRVRFSGKLDLNGLSPFAQRVLRELVKVPYGKTISYGQLAKRAGSAKAARAVGSVVARNPVPIVVPCHRVLSSDGSLGGFSAPGGVKLKRQLLLMENHCLKQESPDKSAG